MSCSSGDSRSQTIRTEPVVLCKNSRSALRAGIQRFNCEFSATRARSGATFRQTTPLLRTLPHRIGPNAKEFLSFSTHSLFAHTVFCLCSNKNGIALQIGLESVGDTCMSDAETCPAAKSLPKIEHMASHTPRGGGGGLSRKLIVADDTNTLRMYFSRNGTLGRTLDVGGAVTAMAKSGPSVALGVGGDVLFVSGTKMDKVILTCSGTCAREHAQASASHLLALTLFPSHHPSVCITNTEISEPGYLLALVRFPSHHPSERGDKRADLAPIYSHLRTLRSQASLTRRSRRCSTTCSRPASCTRG